MENELLNQEETLETVENQEENTGQEAEDTQSQDNENEEVSNDTVPQETSAQKSWRELREQAEEGKRTKKQLEEAYRMLQIMDQKIQQGNQSPQKKVKAETEEEFNIDSLPDDEYTDNKQLKRILKQQQKYYKDLQKEIDSSKQTIYQTSVEARLKSEIPDFRNVVTRENINKLKEEKPHIFRSLEYNPDLYEQALGAYEAIKQFGIYNEEGFNRDEYQLKNNLQKPKPASSLGTHKKKSAIDEISRWNNPSPDDMKAFYEDAIKKSGRSTAYNV